jgi:2-hydroxy-3-oxopropionate reductase
MEQNMAQGDTPLRIAFLGTGLMGATMATRLVKDGFAVTVWNLTSSKAEAVAACGARQAAAPREAVQGAQAVIMSLTDAAAVEDVLFASGAVDELAASTLVIDTTTSSPKSARDQGGRLAQRKLKYLDAPVSGGTRGAAAGTLAIMAGGTAESFAAAQPIFAALGRATHVGPTSAGQLAKLANQVIVAVTIGAVAEALLLAEAGGADPAAVRAALLGGFADSRILAEHGQRMIDRRFTPGGTVTNQLKDLQAAVATAEDCKISLPLLEQVRQEYAAYAAADGAELDHSALYAFLRSKNGM